MVTSSKKESEQRRDAAAQALGLRIILIFISLIGSLFLGLFSKNKFVRLLSAICLIAIGIGFAVYYANEIPNNTEESGKSAVVNEQQIEGSKYKWPQRCREHFGPVFDVIRESFSEFGGFELAQPPIEDVGFRDEFTSCQYEVPLKKPYRYFQKAELDFLHGALVKYKLIASFDESYSKASIEREFEAMKSVIAGKFRQLASSVEQIDIGTEGRNTLKVSYGKFAAVLIDFDLTIIPGETSIMTLNVNAQPGLYDYIFTEAKRLNDEEGAALPAL